MRRPPDLESDRARDVIERVRSIPPGQIAAYSDLDAAAPRYPGAVLAACDEPGLPWHRVVRADGTLAKGERQAALLESEGVALTGEPRRVDLRLARWWDDVDPA